MCLFVLVGCEHYTLSRPLKLPLCVVCREPQVVQACMYEEFI